MYPVDRIVGNPQINNYAPNTPVLQTLDRLAILDEIAIRVSGTLTLASFSVAPTKLTEAVQNLIGAVELSATGQISETFKAAGFDWFSRQMQLLEGTAPMLTDIGTSNQAYDFEGQAKLYLRGARWRNWSNTLLDTRLLSNLSLKLNWRDQTAMVTGGTGGTATLSNTKATLLAREWYGVDVSKTPAFGHLRETELLTNVAVSQQGFQVNNLPVGALIRRMALKGMVGGNAYSDPTDELFDPTRPVNLQIQDGAVYPMQGNYLQLRARNKSQFNLESFPSGHVIWEPSMHATDAEQYDARNKRQLSALVDVAYTASNTNTLAIRTVEHVLPSGNLRPIQG